MSAKEELDHVLTSIFGLTREEKKHADYNNNPHQFSQMVVINIEIMCCNRLIGRLRLHEGKLRILNFKLE